MIRKIMICAVSVMLTMLITACGEDGALLLQNSGMQDSNVENNDNSSGSQDNAGSETPDTNVPDANVPETPDTNVPEIPDTNVPDTSIPETPDINVPETPDVNNPDAGNTGKPIPSNPNLRIISLHANNGTGAVEYHEQDINTTMYFDYTKFTKEGYVFLGWSYNENSSKVDVLDGGTMPVGESDIDVYGVWALPEDTITVTFNPNEATYSFMPKTLSFKKGSSLTLPDIAASKKDYIAVGYSFDKDAQQAEYSPGDSFDTQKDSELYIVWSDGRCVKCKGQTIWLKNVQVTREDWTKKYGFKDKEAPYAYTARWYERSNWYDIDQGFYSLCWAASVSNVLLWWAHENKAYIDAYDELNHTNYAKRYTYTYSSDGKKAFSEVFNLYRTTFPNQGNNPWMGFAWYLYGVDSRSDGGFYKDVFKNTPVIKKYDDISKLVFNYYVTDALLNDKAVSLNIISPTPHEITAWGATYDEDGFIKAIYTTNSYSESATADNKPAGLEYDTVLYDGKNKVSLTGESVQVLNIFTLSLGQKYWDKYFESKNVTVSK